MKLSEAIRLGSLLRPQAFGKTFANGGSCAFGAASEAIGMAAMGEDAPLNKVWPWIRNPSICPECGDREYLGASVISSHLNDRHRWPREQIADWVASVEPQEEQTDGGPGPGVATLEVQAV